MKKLLFILAAMFVANSAMADRVVTFQPNEFDQMTSAAPYVLEKDGIRISVSNGMIKYDHFRVYKNEEMLIELINVPETTVDNVGISCVEIHCIAEDNDQYGPGNFENEAAGIRGEYTYDGYVGTWVDTPVDYEPGPGTDGMYYDHAIAVGLLASGAQVRPDEIVVYIIGEENPVNPTEKTDAPSSAKENYVYNDGNLYYNAYTVTLVETEPSDIYYRIGILVDGEYVYGDWMLYTGELNFSEEGTYMIEAYAIAPGKTESDHIWDGFTVSKMVDVEEMFAGKTVAGVRYYNMAGQEMQQAEGMTIVVTTYTDGTTNAVKVIK